MERNQNTDFLVGKYLTIDVDEAVIERSDYHIPIFRIVSKEPTDPFAIAAVEAFNQTLGRGIDPSEVPELLRRFKICASMLAEYMAEAPDAPQNDYNELEGFEQVINSADIVGSQPFSAQTIQYQVNSAINDCYARIENGADVTAAMGWLQEEVDDIFNGPDRDLRRGR